MFPRRHCRCPFPLAAGPSPACAFVCRRLCSAAASTFAASHLRHDHRSRGSLVAATRSRADSVGTLASSHCALEHWPWHPITSSRLALSGRPHTLTMHAISMAALYLRHPEPLAACFPLSYLAAEYRQFRRMSCPLTISEPCEDVQCRPLTVKARRPPFSTNTYSASLVARSLIYVRSRSPIPILSERLGGCASEQSLAKLQGLLERSLVFVVANICLSSIPSASPVFIEDAATGRCNVFLAATTKKSITSTSSSKYDRVATTPALLWDTR